MKTLVSPFELWFDFHGMRYMANKSAASVSVLIAGLSHPLNSEILALRRLVLDVAPSVREETKWNSPSFRRLAHFATMHLRAQDSVFLILHRGARKHATQMAAIADPDGLLK